MLNFDFIAEPPESGTIVLDVVPPLEASAIMPLPRRIHGVRRYDRHSVLERLVRVQTPDPEVKAVTDGDTFTQSMGHPTRRRGHWQIRESRPVSEVLVVDNAEKPQRSDELEAVSRLVSP